MEQPNTQRLVVCSVSANLLPIVYWRVTCHMSAVDLGEEGQAQPGGSRPIQITRLAEQPPQCPCIQTVFDVSWTVMDRQKGAVEYRHALHNTAVGQLDQLRSGLDVFTLTELCDLIDLLEPIVARYHSHAVITQQARIALDYRHKARHYLDVLETTRLTLIELGELVTVLDPLAREHSRGCDRAHAGGVGDRTAGAG